MKAIGLLFVLCLSLGVFAQETPAPKQTKPVWIQGANVHVGNGEVLKGVWVAFDNGKITYVGDGRTIRINRNEATIIEAQGKNLYPGIIALNTSIGLNEIESVGATQDYVEPGMFQPNIRSIIAYSTDSRVTPTVRSNGILYAQIAPQGAYLSGRSSVVQLDAWNWEDAAVALDNVFHLNWPRNRNDEKPSKEEGKSEVDLIEEFFVNSKSYCEQNKPKELNVKYEAMRNLLNKKAKMFIHVSGNSEIISACEFAKKHNLDYAIVCGTNAFYVLNYLKDNKVKVVLSGIHNLPSSSSEDIQLPYKMPGILAKAGIEFAISADGGWQQRNLPFEAATATGFGLSEADALKAITLNAAKIAGVDKQIGSIEIGKNASFILTTGNLFEMKDLKIEKAFIDGREISLDNKQKRLYKKYSEKYGLPVKE